MQRCEVRHSKALSTAVANAAIVVLCFWLLYLHLVPEPWDLVPVMLITLVCPIAGCALTVSALKRDSAAGANRWQMAAGLLLALASFGYGLLAIVMRN